MKALFKILVSLLLPCTLLGSTLATIGGTDNTNVRDAFLWQRSGFETFNYGSNTGSGQNFIGWANNGSTRQEVYLFWANLSTIPSYAQIDSSKFNVFIQSISVTNPIDVIADTVKENWVEGTALAAYQNGSCSWNNQGFGTGVSGTIAQSDSVWASPGAGLTRGVGTDTITFSSSDNDSFVAVWNVTGIVKDMHNQQNSLSTTGFGIQLYDAAFDAAALQRIGIASTEWTQTGNRPSLDVWYTLPSTTVNSPSANAQVRNGSTYNISITRNLFSGTVKLELDRDYPSGNWETITTGLAGDSYSWLVSGALSNAAAIQVTWEAHTDVKSVSNLFYIVDPILTIEPIKYTTKRKVLEAIKQRFRSRSKQTPVPFSGKAVVAPSEFSWFVDSLRTRLNDQSIYLKQSMPAAFADSARIWEIKVNSHESPPVGHNSQTRRLKNTTTNYYHSLIQAPTVVGAVHGCFDYLDSVAIGKSKTTFDGYKTPVTERRVYIIAERFDRTASAPDSVTVWSKRAIREGRCTGLVIPVNTEKQTYYAAARMSGTTLSKFVALLSWAENLGLEVYVGGRNLSKNAGIGGTYFSPPNDRAISRYTSYIPLIDTLYQAVPDTFAIQTTETTLDESVSGGQLFVALNRTTNDVMRLFKVQFEIKRDATSVTPVSFRIQFSRNDTGYDTEIPGQDPRDGVISRNDYSISSTTYATYSFYVPFLEDGDYLMFAETRTTGGKVQIKNFKAFESAGDPTYIYDIPDSIPTPLTDRIRWIGNGEQAFHGAGSAIFSSSFVRQTGKNILDSIWIDYQGYGIDGVWNISDEVQASGWAVADTVAFSSAGAGFADYTGTLAEYFYNQTGRTHATLIFSDMFDTWHNARQFTRANSPRGGGYLYSRDSLEAYKDYLTLIPWGEPSSASVTQTVSDNQEWMWLAGVEIYDSSGALNCAIESSNRWLESDTIKARGVAFLAYQTTLTQYYLPVMRAIKSKWY